MGSVSALAGGGRLENVSDEVVEQVWVIKKRNSEGRFLNIYIF